MFLFRKVFKYEKWSIIFFRRKTLVSQSRIKSWVYLQCFRKNVVPESFMYNRGYHVFISKVLGRKVPKKFLGIPSRFQNIRDIEKFHSYKGLSRFSVKNLLSDLAEKFCERILLFLSEVHVSKIFTFENGEYHIFPSENFGLTAPKKIASIPAMFQKICGTGKFYV